MAGNDVPIDSVDVGELLQIEGVEVEQHGLARFGRLRQVPDPAALDPVTQAGHGVIQVFPVPSMNEVAEERLGSSLQRVEIVEFRLLFRGHPYSRSYRDLKRLKRIEQR